MTQRFENRLNKDIKKFHALNPIWDNEKQDALNVFEMINLLNELHKENEILKQQLKIYKKDGLETLKDLERAYKNNKKALNNIERLEKENKRLIQFIMSKKYSLNDYLKWLHTEVLI